MYRNLHLELKRNRYYTLCCICAHLLAVSVVSVLALELWLYLLLYALIALSCLWSLYRHKPRQLHVFFDADNKLRMQFAGQEAPASRWQLLWRNRRLIILRLHLSGALLPVTLWISPHSLSQPEQHRYLRIITCFIRSSAKESNSFQQAKL